MMYLFKVLNIILCKILKRAVKWAISVGTTCVARDAGEGYISFTTEIAFPHEPYIVSNIISLHICHHIIGTNI